MAGNLAARAGANRQGRPPLRTATLGSSGGSTNCWRSTRTSHSICWRSVRRLASPNGRYAPIAASILAWGQFDIFTCGACISLAQRSCEPIRPQKPLPGSRLTMGSGSSDVFRSRIAGSSGNRDRQHCVAPGTSGLLCQGIGSSCGLLEVVDPEAHRYPRLTDSLPGLWIRIVGSLGLPKNPSKSCTVGRNPSMWPRWFLPKLAGGIAEGFEQFCDGRMSARSPRLSWTLRSDTLDEQTAASVSDVLQVL
jgi:hypothetical protein